MLNIKILETIKSDDLVSVKNNNTEFMARVLGPVYDTKTYRWNRKEFVVQFLGGDLRVHTINKNLITGVY